MKSDSIVFTQCGNAFYEVLLTLNSSFCRSTLIISISKPDSQSSFTYGLATRAQNLKVQCGILDGTRDVRNVVLVAFRFLYAPFTQESISNGFNVPEIRVYFFIRLAMRSGE